MAWLKRKPRNRRFTEREHLLDVKLRTSQTRAARFRMAGIALSFVFAFALISFVFWRGGQWLLDYFIYKNDAFAIRQIEVQDEFGVISSDTIRRWAMVKTGDNLLALDLMRVKRDLELQPAISFVAVERVLPRTLRLRVSEREPIAQTVVLRQRANGGYEQVVYHLDENGFVMWPLDPRLRAMPPAQNEILPLIVGVNANDLQLGKATENTQVRSALKLISEFDYSTMAGFAEIQRINISTPEILQATTSQGAEITFSLGQFDSQLRRWRSIYDQYQSWGKAIASLDLSIANNLPVRWVGASSVPQLQKTPKLSRTKRKHV